MTETTVLREAFARAADALDASVAAGTLAILDEAAFKSFSADICGTVARRAAVALDTAELLAVIDEQELLEPGRPPLERSWSGRRSEFDLSPIRSHPDRLSFRGQIQYHVADRLTIALSQRLEKAYAEARA